MNRTSVRKTTRTTIRTTVSRAAFALALLVLSGCATNAAQRDAERLALYRAHAGEPVASMQYFGSLNGWTPLGEGAIALWTRPSRAYLVEFIGTCPDIDFARAIQVSNQAGRVHARFDDVRVLDGTSMPSIPCRIASLRPLDFKAIRAEERGLREARAAERQGGGT